MKKRRRSKVFPGGWRVSRRGDLSFRLPSNGLYDISAERVLRTTRRGDATYFDWPLHVGEKPWTSPYDFKEAFTFAVRRRLQKLLSPAALRRVWPAIIDLIEASFAYLYAENASQMQTNRAAS